MNRMCAQPASHDTKQLIEICLCNSLQNTDPWFYLELCSTTSLLLLYLLITLTQPFFIYSSDSDTSYRLLSIQLIDCQYSQYDLLVRSASGYIIIVSMWRRQQNEPHSGQECLTVYFTEATWAIASLPPGHCLGTLESINASVVQFTISPGYQGENAVCGALALSKTKHTGLTLLSRNLCMTEPYLWCLLLSSDFQQAVSVTIDGNHV